MWRRDTRTIERKTNQEKRKELKEIKFNSLDGTIGRLHQDGPSGATAAGTCSCCSRSRPPRHLDPCVVRDTHSPDEWLTHSLTHIHTHTHTSTLWNLCLWHTQQFKRFLGKHTHTHTHLKITWHTPRKLSTRCLFSLENHGNSNRFLRQIEERKHVGQHTHTGVISRWWVGVCVLSVCAALVGVCVCVWSRARCWLT